MEFGNLVKKLFADISILHFSSFHTDTIDSDSLESYMTERAVQLYQELDDIVYDRIPSSSLFSHAQW